MEEQNQTQTKKPSFWSKKLSLPLALFLLIVGGVLGAVSFHSLTVTTTVSEGRSSTNADKVLSAFSGETKTESVSITNAGAADLDSRLSWVETSNPNGVTYTTSLPQTVTTLAGTTQSYDFTYTYAADTLAGDVAGTVVFDPVA